VLGNPESRIWIFPGQIRFRYFLDSGTRNIQILNFSPAIIFSRFWILEPVWDFWIPEKSLKKISGS